MKVGTSNSPICSRVTTRSGNLASGGAAFANGRDEVQYVMRTVGGRNTSDVAPRFEGV